MKFEVVALDIGRVVLDFDFAPMLERVAPRAGRSSREIVEWFRTTDLQETFERGKISPEEFIAEVTTALSLDMTAAEFTRAWNGIFRETEGMADLLAELAPRTRLVAATNTNAPHLSHIRTAFPVLNRFESIVASCEIGWRKPEPEFYREVIARTGRGAGELLFVDDLEDNVLGARRAGMQGHRFEGATRLRSELVSLGIL